MHNVRYIFDKLPFYGSRFSLIFSFLSTQQNHTYVAFIIISLKLKIMLYLYMFIHIFDRYVFISMQHKFICCVCAKLVSAISTFITLSLIELLRYYRYLLLDQMSIILFHLPRNNLLPLLLDHY
nr:MAG TPA: hypothetical protein [Caudoviricetes sp.]